MGLADSLEDLGQDATDCVTPYEAERARIR